MSKLATDYRKNWWARIQKERRQYFFQKRRRQNRTTRFSFIQFLAWAWEDAVYVKKWSLNIFLQLRAYGRTLSKAYEISVWQQLYRLMYLAFYHQVDPANLRGRQLFLPESWKNVDDYTYIHDQSQYLLAEKSFPEEIEIFENKFEFFQFCRAKGIPTPEILAVYENGKVVWPEDSLFDLPHQNLFIKSLNGQAGQGIRRMMWSGQIFKDQEGNEFTPKELSVLLIEESGNNSILLQNVVVNHPSWAGFTSGALATCRIVTAKSPEDESVIPLFAALRMPVGDVYLDNFSKGGFYSGIDIETGRLSSASGLKPVNGRFNFTHHPDSGQKVEGIKLPHWNEVLNFTLSIHSKFNTLFMGWDISLIETGPIVVEGNIGWASRSYECPNMKPLRNTAYPVLYEKWMEKFSNSDE